MITFYRMAQSIRDSSFEVKDRSGATKRTIVPNEALVYVSCNKDHRKVKQSLIYHLLYINPFPWLSYGATTSLFLWIGLKISLLSLIGS